MNGKIIRYQTVQAKTAKELDEAVNALLAKDEAWQPFGSPYFCDRKAEGVLEPFTVCQAMVRVQAEPARE